MEANQSPSQEQSPSLPPEQSQAESQVQSNGDRVQLSDTGAGDEITEALAAAEKFAPFDSQAEEEAAAGDAEGTLSSSPESKGSDDAGDKAPPAPDTDKVRPSQWARFHREQKEFFAQKEAVKAQTAETQRVKSILEKAKEDPLLALETMGYTDIKSFVEQLAENGGRMSPERRELNELKKWRESQEARDAEAKAQAEQAQQQQVLQGKLAQIRADVKKRIQSEQYSDSILNLEDADEHVMLEMDRMATETGEMPNPEDAMEIVKGRYMANLAKLANNPAVFAFFQEKLGAQRLPSNGTPQSKQRAKPKTIAGNTPTPGLKLRDDYKPSLSGDDEVEEALAWLKSVSR